jgi:hypothetical protein
LTGADTKGVKPLLVVGSSTLEFSDSLL